PPRRPPHACPTGDRAAPSSPPPPARPRRRSRRAPPARARAAPAPTARRSGSGSVARGRARARGPTAAATRARAGDRRSRAVRRGPSCVLVVLVVLDRLVAQLLARGADRAIRAAIAPRARVRARSVVDGERRCLDVVEQVGHELADDDL